MKPFKIERLVLGLVSERAPHPIITKVQKTAPRVWDAARRKETSSGVTRRIKTGSLTRKVKTGPVVRLIPIVKIKRVESGRLVTSSSRPAQQRRLGRISKQLRILFCGSDEFSCASLRALHQLQQDRPRLIRSIDVMVRPGKPSGRSLKTIREVPIKAVAQELGLRIHERDTFTGWEPPLSYGRPFNLIVAVSFGLFVPPRILRAAKYGGINVHPSLLPNLRGPAPIHHAILTGQRYTGVTVQTLHEKTFDHGVILAQTPLPGIRITEHDTYSDLHNVLKEVGADLLVKSIKKCLHVPPLKDVGTYNLSTEDLQHAPKITPGDKKIDFRSTHNIMRKYHALGRLWADLYINETVTKRCVFEDFEEVEFEYSLPKSFVRPILPMDSNIATTDGGETSFPGLRMIAAPSPEGKLDPIFYVENGDAIIIVSHIGMSTQYGNLKKHALRVKKVTVAGESTKAAAVALRNLQKHGKWVLGMPGNETGGFSWEKQSFSAQDVEVKEFVAMSTETAKYLEYPFALKKSKDEIKDPKS